MSSLSLDISYGPEAQTLWARRDLKIIKSDLYKKVLYNKQVVLQALPADFQAESQGCQVQAFYHEEALDVQENNHRNHSKSPDLSPLFTYLQNKEHSATACLPEVCRPSDPLIKQEHSLITG